MNPQEDLPQIEWRITSIEYWPNDATPAFRFPIEGVTDFYDYSYCYERNPLKTIDFKDIIVIPGVKNGYTSSLSDGAVISTDGALPTAMDALVSYAKIDFYQYRSGDSVFDSSEWTAKIKIVTATIPITVIP